ncbi:MAG: tetratricopeptide (TPR) repeat protein [Flavobacteriales bacterium]|jgi:tetratricopeptide (TPR) repeat protein
MNRKATLLEMLKEDPKDPFLLYALALEQVKDNDIQAATTVLKELISTQPDYLATYYQLGKLQEQQGQIDDAIETYKKGEKIASEQRDLKTKSELSEAIWELED